MNRPVSFLSCLAVVTVLLMPSRAAAAPRFLPPPPPQALVLEPFGTDLGDAQSTGQDVATTLQHAGFAVTVLQDTQVTVPVMRRLAQYAFIYISTHAGPLPNNDAAVATGETRHQPYSAYFSNNTMAEMRIPRAGIERYFDAVTGLFIHRYDGAFPAHTIVFLNTCNALDLPLFWHYLHASGVATLISWHHHVSSGDADRAAEAMFSALASGQTVADAISTTTAAGAAVSIVKNKKGWLSFSGDGADTLAEASGAAVSSSAAP